MAFQPVPDVAECRIVYTQLNNARPFVNLLYFHLAVGWTNAQLQAVADSLKTQWGNQIMNDMSTDLTLTDVFVRDLSAEFNPVFVAAPADVVGSAAATMAPPNACPFVRFRSSGGPPRRGGIFLPQIAEVNVDQRGQVLAAFRTNLKSDIETAIGNVEALHSSTHSIVSRYQGKNADGTPKLRAIGLSALVVSYEVRERVGSQRDRRIEL